MTTDKNIKQEEYPSIEQIREATKNAIKRQKLNKEKVEKQLLEIMNQLNLYKDLYGQFLWDIKSSADNGQYEVIIDTKSFSYEQFVQRLTAELINQDVIIKPTNTEQRVFALTNQSYKGEAIIKTVVYPRVLKQLKDEGYQISSVDKTHLKIAWFEETEDDAFLPVLDEDNDSEEKANNSNDND